MAILVAVLLVLALLGTALAVFVIYFHGVFPALRSLQSDPDFNEMWQEAGARFRLGFVGGYFGTAVGGVAAGVLLVTGHLWQGAVVFVLGMTITFLMNRERLLAIRRYRERKGENADSG